MFQGRTREASATRYAPRGWGIPGLLVKGLLALALARIGPAAEAFQESRPPIPTLGESLGTAVSVPADPIPNEQPPLPEYPLDLSVALRLADVENPEIAAARARILHALAVRQGACALLLPTLQPGTNYHAHNGNLQRSSGEILSLSQQALYVGGGARTLAAETVMFPAVLISSPLTEAWFEPLAAKQGIQRARFDAVATANNTLGEVAVLYLDLLGAHVRLEARRLAEAQTAEVARITRGFADSGEGRQADADRAEVHRQLRRAEVQAAEGEVAVASARLAQQLNLDPSVHLRPRHGPLAPIVLVDPASNPAELTAIALQRRPELIARTAEIAQARVRLQEEIYRPLIPSIWLGFSGGMFGGGSNLSQPNLGRFGGRTDFDIRVYWTILNFGRGNFSLQRERRAEIGQAVARRTVMVNEVRREVASALAVSGARVRQIDQARRQLAAADSGFREDLERARQNLGRPIEVLNNLDMLTEARLALIDAITEYNQAQFRLFVALGSPPPPGQLPSDPVPPPPVNTPIHAPFSIAPNLLESKPHVAPPIRSDSNHFRLISAKF